MEMFGLYLRRDQGNTTWITWTGTMEEFAYVTRKGWDDITSNETASQFQNVGSGVSVFLALLTVLKEGMKHI